MMGLFGKPVPVPGVEGVYASPMYSFEDAFIQKVADLGVRNRCDWNVDVTRILKQIIVLVYKNGIDEGCNIFNTIEADHVTTPEKAIKEIFNKYCDYEQDNIITRISKLVFSHNNAYYEEYGWDSFFNDIEIRIDDCPSLYILETTECGGGETRRKVSMNPLLAYVLQL